MPPPDFDGKPKSRLPKKPKHKDDEELKDDQLNPYSYIAPFGDTNKKRLSKKKK